MPQSSFDSTDLPALEPHTHCVLIPRDPNFIYAYWDYTQEDIDRARISLSSKAKILNLYFASMMLLLSSLTVRMRIIPGTLMWVFQPKIGTFMSGRTTRIIVPNLGLDRGQNHFIPLTRSNIVRTPPKSASKRDDLIWQDIKAHRNPGPISRKNRGLQSINQQH